MRNGVNLTLLGGSHSILVGPPGGESRVDFLNGAEELVPQWNWRSSCFVGIPSRLRNSST